jgi:hypothetical protein
MRHEHLAARRLGVVQRHQRAGDRPGAQVAVALIPDQAGFVDILAADVEAQDRDRQMPPALVEGQKLMPADDLAAADAVGIVQHDVEGLDLGMGGQEGLGLGKGGTGGAGIGIGSGAWSGCGFRKSSVRMASKLAISRSTWRSSWPG